MEISGKVVKVEYLRGGVSVIIDPVSGPLDEDPYFKSRPRGTFEVLGLKTEIGKDFRAGANVTIDIHVDEVTATPVEAEDDAHQDEVSGD